MAAAACALGPSPLTSAVRDFSSSISSVDLRPAACVPRFPAPCRSWQEWPFGHAECSPSRCGNDDCASRRLHFVRGFVCPLAAQVKRREDNSAFVRWREGLLGLREWKDAGQQFNVNRNPPSFHSLRSLISPRSSSRPGSYLTTGDCATGTARPWAPPASPLPTAPRLHCRLPHVHAQKKKRPVGGVCRAGGRSGQRRCGLC